jgi:hypothetical protein
MFTTSHLLPSTAPFWILTAATSEVEVEKDTDKLGAKMVAEPWQHELNHS